MAISVNPVALLSTLLLTTDGPEGVDNNGREGVNNNGREGVNNNGREGVKVLLSRN